MTHQEDLFGRRLMLRLTQRELYTVATWLKDNMANLQRVRTTRASAAVQASNALGFEVRPSAIQTAERMIDCTMAVPRQSLPGKPLRTRAEIATLKARLDRLEKIIQTSS